VKKAGDLLHFLFNETISEKAQRYHQFFKEWQTILGNDFHGHVMLDDIQSNTLLLIADHPGWKQRVVLNQRQLLEILQRKYPEMEVKRLSIRVRSSSRRKPSKSRQETMQNRTEDVEEALKSIENESFKDKLEKLKKAIDKKWEPPKI
jgi:hypothetical protein